MRTDSVNNPQGALIVFDWEWGVSFHRCRNHADDSVLRRTFAGTADRLLIPTEFPQPIIDPGAHRLPMPGANPQTSAFLAMLGELEMDDSHVSHTL